MKYIQTFLLVFLLTGCQEKNNIDEIATYNNKIAHLYPKSGQGYLASDYNLNFDKLIQFSNGSCWQQAYLVARYAKQHGYNAQTIGLFAANGANDYG